MFLGWWHVNVSILSIVTIAGKPLQTKWKSPVISQHVQYLQHKGITENKRKNIFFNSLFYSLSHFSHLHLWCSFLVVFTSWYSGWGRSVDVSNSWAVAGVPATLDSADAAMVAFRRSGNRSFSCINVAGIRQVSTLTRRHRTSVERKSRLLRMSQIFSPRRTELHCSASQPAVPRPKSHLFGLPWTRQRRM